MIGRLVEKQEVRAAHQRLREVQAHAPAAGETGDGVAMAGCGEPESGEQRRGAGAGRVAADVVEPVMEQRERFAVARHMMVAGVLGGQRASARSPAVRRSPSCTNSIAGVATAAVSCATCAIVQAGGISTLPASWCISPQDQREEARFAAPVRADESDLVSRVDGEARAVEQTLRAAGENEVGNAKHRAIDLRARGRRPVALT